MNSLEKEEYTLPVVEPRGQTQIGESRGTIEALKKRITDQITKIRSDTDMVENERRIREESEREQRSEKIKNEVHRSYKENIGIDFKWQELEEKEDCEELAQEIEAQKSQCQKIIHSKEELIKEFQDTLRGKDEEYVKSLEQQGKNIDELIKLMRSQFNTMRDEYNTQLNEIEAAFKKEREEILGRNNQEIEILFQKHQKTEEHFLLERTKNEAKYQEELEALRSSEANDQQEQKIKLENELQTLQKCMEDMKAVYKLNEEKLDFNLRVLKEREDHNKQTKTNMIKKLNRLKEKRRNLISDYEKENTKLKNKNIELTNSYKRITLQFKELQKKFRRFKKSDERRFDEIWTMNQNEVFALVDKITQADRVIHEQQLGIKWDAPKDPIFNNPDARNENQAKQNISVADSQGQSKIDIGDTQSHMTGGDKAEEGKVPIRKIKNVFQLLIDEMPYLIEDKVEQECDGKSASAIFKLQLDAVRKSLDITDKTTLYMLVNTFYDYSNEKKAGVYMDDQEQKQEDVPDDATQEDEELDIDGGEILEVLRRFQKRKEEYISNAMLSGNPRNKKRPNFQNEEQKKELDQKAENYIWQKMTTILDERKLSVWNALDKALAKYYGLLVERKNLIDDTGLLNQQNEELKTLLNQYLQAGVNHELKVPPTQVIKLDM
jgi:dynein regulatry complex protein 1